MRSAFEQMDLTKGNKHFVFKAVAFKILSKTPLWVPPILASTGVVLLATAVLNRPPAPIDSRTFDVGIEVKINRTSPAFAALEDSSEGFDRVSEDVNSQVVAVAKLAAGGIDLSDKAEALVAQNLMLEQAQTVAQVIAQKVEDDSVARVRAFLEATFFKKSESKDEQQTRAVAKTYPITKPQSHVAFKLAAPRSGTLIVTGHEILPYDEDTASQTNVASTPIATSSETKTINLAELQISRDELMRGLIMPLMSAQQKPTVARAGASNPRSIGRSVQRAESPAAAAAFGSVDSMQRPFAEKPVTTDGVSALMAPETKQDPGPKTISGTVEMQKGLALTSGKDEIVVYREVEGERIEWGNVWVRQGKYEIYVQAVQGLLVAELQNSGEVLGRGEFDLQTFAGGNVALKISPLPRGLAGRVQSAYSDGAKIEPVNGAEIKIDGVDLASESKKDGSFKNDQLAPGSVVVTQTKRPGYWGTMSFAKAGDDSPITLFPNKMMEAFSSVVGSKDKITGDQPPVIWGRVTSNGKAVAGATVELLTGEKEVKPVYFNALMIPDSNLKSTSANGLYAFFPVEDGVQVVQARYAGHVLEPIVVPAEPGFVSVLDLETSRTMNIAVKVFDAFRTNLPLSAEIRTVGSEKVFRINPTGEAKAKIARANGLMVFDASAGDKYASTRVSIHGETRSVLIPMFQQAWIDKVINSLRINRDADTGIVVGFVQAQERYQIYPSSDRDSSEIKVVYFDRAGRPVTGGYGVPGGGYIVFNVPEGMATLSLVSERVSGVQALTTLTERDVVNVIHHTVR